MNHSILYYPTIEFQPEDYDWLWNAALLWDKIYRIVPPGYDLHEPRNIRELCDNDDIGIAISPVRYARDASERFLDFLKKDHGRAAALSFYDQAEVRRLKIHSAKIDEQLLGEMFYRLRDEDYQGDWLFADPESVNAYLTFLANEIAEKNSLSMYTNEQPLWTMSTYYQHDGMLQDMFYSEKGCGETSEAVLLSSIIADVFPQNILDIEPKKILRFREIRKDERSRFLAAVERFDQRIREADAPEVIETIFNDERKEIETALSDYQKSMDVLGALTLGGYLTTAFSVGAAVWESIQGIPPIANGIGTLAGPAVSVLTGIWEKKANRSNTPYSYLAHVKNAFSHAPNSGLPFDDRLGQYNYSLSRGIEEFISD